MSPKVNILLSSAGRRVERLFCFREALEHLALHGSVLATDCSKLAPALYLADRAWTVPRCSDPDFVQLMLDLTEAESVLLLIPNLDHELPLYASTREKFAVHGTVVVVSSPDAIRICRDKALTHYWLSTHGFPTVRQARAAEIFATLGSWHFPVVAKPVDGSGSVGLKLVQSPRELELIAESKNDHLIFQEVAQGTEFTINVYVDKAGGCVCAVPHARLEVRSGEVSKGVTVRHAKLMTLARDIAESLPGAYGPLNIQCFLAEDGDIRVIEINPRFGGGYPLAHRAGAKFTHWLIQEALGERIPKWFDAWEDGLVMIRYNEAVYLSHGVSAAQIQAWKSPALRSI